jgi:hypothetical protein
MNENMIKFGYIMNPGELHEFIWSLIGAADDPILVKPNWANSLPQSFPHFQALFDMLDCFSSNSVYVIESYTAWRNHIYRNHFLNTNTIEWDSHVTPENGKDMWKWLKNEDEWFLQFFGFKKYFRDHDVTYINCTEELWNGRTTSVEDVRRYLGEKSTLLQNQSLLETVPESLLKLRGHILINFTKLYDTGLYVAKNLMGLIPEPNRTQYHGENNALLIQNIHDINIIYRSLFQVIDIVESLRSYHVIFSGTNPAQLDEIGCVVLGTELQDQYHDVKKARDVFGSYSPVSLSHIPLFIQDAIKGHASGRI